MITTVNAETAEPAEMSAERTEGTDTINTEARRHEGTERT